MCSSHHSAKKWCIHFASMMQRNDLQMMHYKYCTVAHCPVLVNPSPTHTSGYFCPYIFPLEKIWSFQLWLTRSHFQLLKHPLLVPFPPPPPGSLDKCSPHLMRAILESHPPTNPLPDPPQADLTLRCSQHCLSSWTNLFPDILYPRAKQNKVFREPTWRGQTSEVILRQSTMPRALTF